MYEASEKQIEIMWIKYSNLETHILKMHEIQLLAGVDGN
jgi:hypothetical protein